MAMQQATAGHNARPDSEKLELRVGAHVGPSVVDRDDYYGMAVTWKLERRVPGAVFLSEAVRQAAAWPGGPVRLGGDLGLKGVTGTVTTHELCWQPVTAAILPLPPCSPGAAPRQWSGRDDELRLLNAALEDAGGPQLLLVEGEPGMGKTRLVANAPVERTPRRCAFSTVRSGQNWIPYEPFVEALTWLVLACPIDELRLDVGAGGARVAPGRARGGSADVADVPSPLDGDPSGERRRIVVALAAGGGRRKADAACSRGHPGWIDDASLRVLEAALTRRTP